MFQHEQELPLIGTNRIPCQNSFHILAISVVLSITIGIVIGLGIGIYMNSK